jgi:hypothetical protein
MGYSRDHKLVAGHQSAATMAAATKIRDWPVQTDMGQWMDWLPPSDPAGWVPKYPDGQIVTAADGTRKGRGFLVCRFVFDRLTYDMLSYIYTNFLPSGVQSADVTIATYDDEGAVVYMQGEMSRPVAGVTMTHWQGRGWQSVRFDITQGVVVT